MRMCTCQIKLVHIFSLELHRDHKLTATQCNSEIKNSNPTFFRSRCNARERWLVLTLTLMCINFHVVHVHLHIIISSLLSTANLLNERRTNLMTILKGSGNTHRHLPPLSILHSQPQRWCDIVTNAAKRKEKNHHTLNMTVERAR